MAAHDTPRRAGDDEDVDTASPDPVANSTAAESRSDDVMPQVPRWLELAAGWAWRLLVVAAAIWAIWRGAAILLVVTLPLVVALVLATLCIPAQHWLVRRGLGDALAALVVVVGGAAGLVGLLAGLAPAFIEQVQNLGPTVVEGYEAVLNWLETGPFGIDQAQLQDFVDRTQSMLSGGGGGSGVVTGVLSGVSTVGQFLAGLALMVVLLFFVVKDHRELLDWTASRLPARHRNTATALGTRAWSALSGYVRGTALIALIDAVGIGIGLAVLGVPLVLPLTVLVFFGGFLPVVGALLAGLVAVLVALTEGIGTAAAVLALILVVQQVEGNLLQPTIMRRAVALHPIVVLSALAAGAAVGGIIGAFLAVPLAAVAAAVGNEVRLRHEAGLLGADPDVVPATPLAAVTADETTAEVASQQA